ncbi:hypothetical protein Acr_29g0011690 [Actinidia rufa]|uniref:Uncharacterized protein n=1 Tax=Actinidia rufa TaxID=165716 RepID=A0A7J0HFU3_9ERIC|nr:hypothetical protein Acr_29g0011690 [Actinidia rufa]
MGQLEDPLEMVFTRPSPGYDVETNFLPSMVDDSWYLLDTSSINYNKDILVPKRHAKWGGYLHMNKAAGDVHRWKLILKMDVA